MTGYFAEKAVATHNQRPYAPKEQALATAEGAAVGGLLGWLFGGKK